MHIDSLALVFRRLRFEFTHAQRKYFFNISKVSRDFRKGKHFCLTFCSVNFRKENEQRRQQSKNLIWVALLACLKSNVSNHKLIALTGTINPHSLDN